MGAVTSEALIRDNLVIGSADELTTDHITIISGAGVLVRGTVLGKITASGKYITCLSAAGDGSNAADAILAEAVDATAGDKVAAVYLSGEFNQAALTFGTGTTIANSKDPLRLKGIFLKTVTP